MDMTKMDRIKVDDLQLRPEVFALRLERRAKLRDAINAGMPDDRQGRRRVQARRVLRPGAQPGRLGPGPRGVRPPGRDRRRPATGTAATRSARAACWPAGWSRPARGRRGHLAQGRQLRQPLVGPPRRPDQPDERPVRPDARRGPLRPDRRPGRARAARRRRWSSPSASSAAARRRASAPPATATAPTAATTGRTATRPSSPARASSAATSTASPTRPARPRSTDPVHPGELLATIYHAFGIDPATIVYNHLNQPRELVKADAVTRLFG